MSSELLKSRATNGWSLFWLVSVPMSILMLVEMMGVDMSNGQGVSHMIGYSVRFAVPFIFLVVAASSMHSLFPGPFTLWWLRNRKYIGMMFAVAMAWQGFFIFMMSVFFRDYYYDDVFYLRDELEGSTGYIFLTAMVLTSFKFGRRFVSQWQWKVLHTAGIFYLWAYPFSVYWWNLSYYPDPQPIDYVFYWMGFLAVAVRIAAWGKRRLRVARNSGPELGAPPAVKILGAGIIVFGLVVAATGRRWQDAATSFLTKPEWSANLELWFPYWPFEPYLSLFIIWMGTWLLTKARSPSPGE